MRNFLGYDVRGAVSNLTDVEGAIARHYADKEDSIEDVLGALTGGGDEDAEANKPVPDNE